MSESKFPGPLFDGKIDFTMWQCTIQDVLVRDSLDLALGEEKPAEISEKNWATIQKKAVSAIRLALAPEIKYNVLKETTPEGI